MRSDVVPGAVFPDYAISDREAKVRQIWSMPTSSASSLGNTDGRVFKRLNERCSSDHRVLP